MLERFALQGHFYSSARGIFICPNFIKIVDKHSDPASQRERPMSFTNTSQSALLGT